MKLIVDQKYLQIFVNHLPQAHPNSNPTLKLIALMLKQTSFSLTQEFSCQVLILNLKNMSLIHEK